MKENQTVNLKWIFASLIALVIATGLILAYRATSKERSEESEREKPVVAESQVKRDSNGEVTIHLESEAQKRLALKTTALVPFQLHSEIKAYGQVLDPTPLAALIAELASDRAAVEASREEFDRMKTLSMQNNTSARALQAAQSTSIRDQVQADNAYQRLIAAWGKNIAERKDLADFVQSLVLQQSALVRVDLMAGDVLKKTPQSARLFAVLDENNPIEAQFISAAPAIDPQAQGQGLFFLALTNEPQFSPGASLTAYLPDSNETLAGFEIPREAVVRFNGQAWFYLQTSDELFTRHQLESEHPTMNGWFISADLKPETPIVVGGAQMLLSEEQKAQIQTGD